ncbi:MAG TPA: translocation/assembly module TamB domain-containing protein, partial [Flavobacterium sp.]
DINLDNVRVVYDDAITKNKVNVDLTHFDTHFRNFDLDNMKFDVPTIRLDGLKLILDQGLVEEIAQTSVEVADTIAKRPDFDLTLGEIRLTRINIGYDNVGTSLNTGLTLGELLMEFDQVDVNRQLVALKNFEVRALKGNLAFGKHEKISVPETDTTAIKQGWKLRLNKTTIADVDFKFDDANSPAVARGIDFAHLDITDFNLEAQRIVYSTDTISGNIQALTVKDKSGLNIQELGTEFFYGSRGAYLKDLMLRTPQTTLKDQITVTYPSIEAISKDLASLSIDAAIRDSHIGFKDILLFVPTLRTTNPFNSNPNAVLHINTRLTGRISDINIPILQVSGIGNTLISARGRITGLPDTDKAYFDITINDFRSTSRDIAGFVPKGTIPSNISLPSKIALNGSFKGAINNFNTDLNLRSSYGNAKVDAKFDQRRKNAEKYDANVVLSSFHLGKLLKNDSIGRISLTTKVSGTGLNPKTANATLRGMLRSAEYNNYTYRDLAFNGDIANGNFNVAADISEPNLDLSLDASGGFNDKYPSAKIKLNVDIADLEKLNLHAGPLKIRGYVDADIPTADPDYLNANIALHHLQYLAADDPIVLDSINIIATATPELNTLQVRSQILKADVEGKYKLTELAASLQNSIAHYFDTNPKGKKPVTGEQNLKFDLTVQNDPVLFKLVPQISGLEPININGRYNSVSDSIVVKATIPRLNFGTNIISGANFNIDTQNDALVYDLNVDAFESGQIKVPYTSFTGDVSNNKATYNLQIRDNEKKDQYVIAGDLTAENGNTIVQLDVDRLKLDYETWALTPDNMIRFGKDGIYVNNFKLSNEGNAIEIQSESQRLNAPLTINFTDFDVATILNMVNKEKPIAGGLINGQVNLRNLSSSPVFTSDLNITGLQFQGQPVGDLAIKVNNQTADTYIADVAITGNGNQVNLTGSYKASSGIFNLDLDMARLGIENAQAFSMGQITDGSGFLSGRMKITGTADNPNIDGDINFNDVAMRVTQLNSYFKNITEKITFNDRGIRLDSFTVSDEKNNELVINGSVLTSNYKDYECDMTVVADNFRAINSKAKDNELFYGDLFLDTSLIVKGTPASPVVSGSLRINEETNFSVVLPQSDPAIADREGIVEFVDEDNVLLQETIVMKETMNTTQLAGMNVSVAIEIVKEAALNLIIDKGNGDFLNLKGEAMLQGGIDPSGKTTLTGKYEFTEGAYEMTFNMLKRKFEIKPGSYIIWNGEPTAANVSLTAIYRVEAPPIDLLGDQLGGVSQSVRNTYKQDVPFETLLKMNGELLKPEISFDITIPEGNHNVSSDIITASENKLEQLRQEPAELNKQVFALLLLNRFIGENPFASEAGSGGAESLARQSVSKLLSQQMNNFAGDLIKGVELNFDLESTEDYTTGVKENRTDLNVGLSKRLLNDRLKVTVGSSFGLEGTEQQGREANTIAGDLSADYQLTKDGRYLVRAYRKNDYQVALQGQVVETGVAFVLTMDYNKFRELFHTTEEEKEMRREEKERKKRERANAEKDAKEKEEKAESDKNTENNE